MKEVITAILMLIGSTFMLLAAVGITRMPDTFMRIQPATKASTLGVGCLLLAVAVHFENVGVTARVFAGISFFILTSPVAAHMIGRAAYIIGVPQWKGTTRDELKGHYNLQTNQLLSEIPDSDENEKIETAPVEKEARSCLNEPKA